MVAVLVDQLAVAFVDPIVIDTRRRCSQRRPQLDELPAKGQFTVQLFRQACRGAAYDCHLLERGFARIDQRRQPRRIRERFTPPAPDYGLHRNDGHVDEIVADAQRAADEAEAARLSGLSIVLAFLFLYVAQLIMRRTVAGRER